MQAEYPKIFKYGVGWLIFIGLFGLGFTVLGLSLTYAGVTGLEKTASILYTWVGVAFSVMIVLITAPCFYMQLTMMSDRLIYRGYIRTLTILRSDIERTSRLRNSYGILFIDIKVRGRRWRPSVSNFGQDADAFLAWFSDLPNAELEQRQRRSDALLSNPRFGDNPAEREDAVNHDARWLNRLRWPCFLMVVWGFIYPYPYNLCLDILMAMPAIAVLMAALSRRRWSVNDDDTSGRLGLGTMMGLGPALAVALRAFLDDHMTSWILPLLAATALACLLILVVAVVEWRFKWKLLLFLSPVYFAYAWGGILYIDTSFDPMPSLVWPVRVLKVDQGDKTNELKVSGWGARISDNTVSVGRVFIRHVHVGDTVCVFAHPGRLTLPWYEVGDCPVQKS